MKLCESIEGDLGLSLALSIEVSGPRLDNGNEPLLPAALALLFAGKGMLLLDEGISEGRRKVLLLLLTFFHWISGSFSPSNCRGDNAALDLLSFLLSLGEDEEEDDEKEDTIQEGSVAVDFVFFLTEGMFSLACSSVVAALLFELEALE